VVIATKIKGKHTPYFITIHFIENTSIITNCSNQSYSLLRKISFDYNYKHTLQWSTGNWSEQES